MRNRKKILLVPQKAHVLDKHVQMFQAALGLHQQGKLSEAKLIYEEILSKNSNHFDALHLSGVLANQSGRLEEAEAFYKKAILINSNSAPLHSNRGNMLKEMKRFDEALASYDKAISLQKDFATALNNRGNTLKALKRFDEALASYDKAISIKSDYADAFNNQGVLLQDLKRFEEALASYDKAISIKPDYAEAFNNRGNTFTELKQFDEALASFDKAISIKPDYAEAFNNRGNTFTELQRLDEALASFDKAISIRSDFAEAFNNRGSILHQTKRFYEALKSYEKSISIKPDFAQALHNRGFTLQNLNLFEEALGSYEAAINQNPDYFVAQSNRLYLMSYMQNLSASDRLEEARKFGSNVTRAARRKFTFWNNGTVSKKLRLGFISGDLRRHSVGLFLESVLSRLDQSKLHLIAYSNNSVEDTLTVRLKKYFRPYKSLDGLVDEEAANLIHDDEVQILIDLSGHTAFNRLPVFAYKAAPIQVSWLGYWATTGVKEIDYLIGDPYVTPLEEAQHFSEKIKRLPETYFCFTQPDIDVEVKDLPAKKNGYITFGCFNNFSKINKSVITLWSKVLLSIDRSRLFLKTEQLGDSSLIYETVGLFTSCGVSAERLHFEGQSNFREYLESYNKIDIALDPFPFPGGTTSAQALWMGVPVLTKKGNRFISHNGETIAHNSRQADWIADDDNDYLAKAIHFSSDIQALAKLRSGLRAQVLGSPLFDADRFARNFENAMFEIWEEYKSGMQRD
jgi:predicted O-linked N-acetylglucosamine transferase (SPINDLY family)